LARPVRLAAFHYRNYTLFWVSQVASNVGSWMQIVASGWLVLQITDSPASLGYNAAFQGAPILVFALIGGLVADRFDRYKLTVWAQVVQIVPDAVLAWLVMSGGVRVEHVFAYSFITATINGLSTPARQAFVPSLVPKEALLSAMSLNSIVWQGAAVVGPALAGLILARWGLPGSFNLNVLSDFIGLGTLVFMRLPKLVPVVQRSSAGWQGLREGASYAWRNERVRVLLFSIGLFTLLTRPYQQLMPVFARDVFQVGPEGLGVMLTLPAMGTIAAGVVLAAMGRVSLVRSFVVTATIAAVALIGFCMTRNLAAALPLLFLIGGCSTATNTVVNTMIQEHVDDRVRGRVMSLFMAATWGTWRIGSLPEGIAAQAWGAPIAVGVGAAILLVALLPTARSQGLRQAGLPPIDRAAALPVSA
jgi:MFS family permease